MFVFPAQHSAQKHQSSAFSSICCVWSCRFHLFQTFLFLSYSRDWRTHKHLCPVLHTCQPRRCRSSFQLSKAIGQHGPHGTALSWFANSYGRGSAQIAGGKLSMHEQGWLLFFKPHISTNAFGLERSLGMALIWPQGLGKEPPTRSPVGVQLLLTSILNEPCPAHNTTNYRTHWAKCCSIQTLSITPHVSGSPPPAPRSLLKLFKHSPLPSLLLLLLLLTSPLSKPNNFPFPCYIKIICRKSNILSSGLSSISRVY